MECSSMECSIGICTLYPVCSVGYKYQVIAAIYHEMGLSINVCVYIYMMTPLAVPCM